MKKIVFNLDEARKKQLKIVLYLVISQFIGWLLAELVKKPDLAVIFGTALNYIAYQIELEIKQEGLSRIIEETK